MRTLEFNGSTFVEDCPNLYLAKRFVPGLLGTEYVEVQVTDLDNDLYTWKSYYLPSCQSTATGAEKLFSRYMAVGWETTADDAMGSALNAFYEFRSEMQELINCKAYLMGNQARTTPLTQPEFNPHGCNSKWVKQQTQLIPDALKPGWRTVYKHLRNVKSPDIANRFLHTHAQTALTCKSCGEIAIPSVCISPMDGGSFHVGANCPSCNAWVKWLKAGGSHE